MKKLIAMIGAVAMAFGLYAEGTSADNYYANSFEVQAEGVTDKTWTPEDAKWTTEQTEAFTLDDQDQTGLPYYTGAARRDSLFKGETLNNNFLKLETGTNSLARGIDANQVYFDQLVKFTGYEEDPAIADGTKIAVWLSAIESDATATPDPIEGETNLYVTVGTGTAATKVQIDPASVDLTEFAVDTWYRITIKSLGDVIENKTDYGVETQAGFVVFINGKQAEIVDKQAYHAYAGAFSAAAKALYDDGKLFTAIDTSDAVLATVAYQGIGGVDDIVFSQEAPDFDSFVDVTFGSITGAEIVSIKDAKGNVIPFEANPVHVAAGEMEVTIKAAPGYILKKDGVKVDTLVKTATAASSVTIELDAEDYVEAVAKIGTDYFETVEEALTAVEDGDTVEFLQECGSIDGNYAFTPGTTIAVAQGGNWTVNIASYVKDEMEFGLLTDHLGLAAEKQVVVNFANEWNVLALAGKIAGDGRVATLLQANGCVALDDALTVGDDEGAGAVLKAETVDTYSAVLGEPVKITLGLNGAVITQSELTESDFGEIPTGYVLDIDTTTLEDWTIYSLALEAEPVAKINDVTYNTLADAFAEVDDNQTITLLAAVDESVLYEGAKKFTIDLNGQTWTWNGGQTGNWAALKVFGDAADITIVDGDEDGLGKMYAAGNGFCIWAKRICRWPRCAAWRDSFRHCSAHR